MLFFRSEEMLDEWLDLNRVERGEVFTVPRLWELSKRWYHNRLLPDYHGRTLEQVQQIFDELSLASSFWRAE